jgi:triosephosphate isomerase
MKVARDNGRQAWPRLSGASNIPILYGGSVNKDNSASLLAAMHVDGVLVGGACLDPSGWATICRT